MSPALRALAWVDAGTCWSAAARASDLTAEQVGDIVLARALNQLHDLQVSHGVQLLATDEEGCRIHRCPSGVHHRRLCVKHYTRLYHGRPLIGPRRVRERSCRYCGIRWCLLPGQTSLAKTCGDRACLNQAQRRDPGVDRQRLARDEAIMVEIRAGVQYRRIATQFGLSEPRIGQMARAAGVHRYANRTKPQSRRTEY